MNKNKISIFFLGFTSGLPFLLILSTLSAWLSESGCSKTQIGLFAFVTLPYVFKFAWAPYLEFWRFPIFGNSFGHKKCWLILSQVILMFGLYGLSLASPADQIYLTGFFALLIGFASATQDILVENFRLLHNQNPNQSGHLAGSQILGYRFGMLVSGSLALYLAEIYSWTMAYQSMACLMMIGIITSFYIKNNPHISEPYDLNRGIKIFNHVTKHFITNNASSLGLIIGFIFFFKFIDISLQSMSIPFLLEHGFTKIEIAHIAKTLGISAMIFGVILGDRFLEKYNLYTAIWICIVLQFLSGALFWFLSIYTKNYTWLIITIGVENFASGFSQLALVSYFSSLCRAPFFGSHYAFLSSISSFIRILISIVAGYMADVLAWQYFYVLVSLGVVPLIFILRANASHYPSSATPSPENCYEDLVPSEKVF